MKKLMFGTMSTVILTTTLALPLTVEAKESNNINNRTVTGADYQNINQEIGLTEEIIKKSEPYVRLSKDKVYSLDEKASEVMTDEEIQIVKKRMEIATEFNKNELQNLVVSGDKVVNKQSKTTALRATSEGINKFESYYWGWKAWLSKTTVRKIMNIGGGAATTYIGSVLGGIGGVVAGVILGGVLAEFANPYLAQAIYFEYNYDKRKFTHVILFNK